MLREEICACCGNVSYPTPCHAYKEQYKDKVKWFCKYTCMLKYRKTHKARKKRMVNL